MVASMRAGGHQGRGAADQGGGRRGHAADRGGEGQPGHASGVADRGREVRRPPLIGRGPARGRRTGGDLRAGPRRLGRRARLPARPPGAVGGGPRGLHAEPDRHRGAVAPGRARRWAWTHVPTSSTTSCTRTSTPSSWSASPTADGRHRRPDAHRRPGAHPGLPRRVRARMTATPSTTARPARPAARTDRARATLAGRRPATRYDDPAEARSPSPPGRLTRPLLHRAGAVPRSARGLPVHPDLHPGDRRRSRRARRAGLRRRCRARPDVARVALPEIATNHMVAQNRPAELTDCCSSWADQQPLIGANRGGAPICGIRAGCPASRA